MSFEKNIQRWMLFFPKEAQSISQHHCDHCFFTSNPNGTRNLSLKTYSGTKRLHDETPVEEAAEWFKSLDLKGIDTLFVYGIGLGYYYEAALDWLKEKKERRIVFFERDLEVISRFLETEKASRFLHDKQAWLQYIDMSHFQNLPWLEILVPFSLLAFHVSALKSYAELYAEEYKKVSTAITFNITMYALMAGEYSLGGSNFLINYYQNLFSLPNAHQASKLFGKFSGMPAVICGAGPSLDKNLALLETLGDKALIFAGGTAMNAVNSHGFWPHFGLGIDPNPAQWSRLIMNTAYEVPYLYRGRIHHQSLNYIQGEILYVPGSGGYLISDWFEKELNISGTKVEEGHNVINFSLYLAYTLGCNPIILVGVDLAYSDQRSYHSGLVRNPIQKDLFLTKRSDEELITINDIYGRPVSTVWKWLAESSWYAQFAATHPEVSLINATEGGIGMAGIPNQTLKDAADHFLVCQNDFRVYVHGEVQNGKMPLDVTEEKIYAVLEKMHQSFQRCFEYCEGLEKEVGHFAQEIEMGYEPSAKPTENDNILWKQLLEEPAYKYFLKEFNAFHFQHSRRDQLQLLHDISVTPREKERKDARFDEERYRFVKEVAGANVRLIHLLLQKKQLEAALFPESKGSGLQVCKLQQSENSNSVCNLQTCRPDPLDVGYTYNQNTFTIIDPEMNLNVSKKYYADNFKAGNGRSVLYYSNGAVKYEKFYQDMKLHGPVTFYSEEKRILARSWWVEGKEQGKAFYYYPSGDAYGVERFRNGLRHGKQEYYYPNGGKKTVLEYSEGKLCGNVHLYYPNGKPKKEQTFDRGLRHGIERCWNNDGVLVLQAEYDHDRPVGTAKQWQEDGQPMLEVTYNADYKPISMRKWNPDGTEKSSETVEGDYFDSITKHTELFTQSLDKVFENLQQVAPLVIPREDFTDKKALQDDFSELKKEMEHLHKLNEQLLFESGMHADNPSEPIWKTPQIQREMQQQLTEITEKLGHDLKSIQNLMKHLKDQQKGKEKHE